MQRQYHVVTKYEVIEEVTVHDILENLAKYQLYYYIEHNHDTPLLIKNSLIYLHECCNSRQKVLILEFNEEQTNFI